jgi:hypothetical protein
VPDWNQRVVCRANVPREERSRGLLSVGESEFEENGSKGKPYTSASLRKGSLYVGTSVWHRDAQAIANSCWEGISVHHDLERLDYTPAPMGSRRNHPINQNLSRMGF